MGNSFIGETLHHDPHSSSIPLTPEFGLPDTEGNYHHQQIHNGHSPSEIHIPTPFESGQDTNRDKRNHGSRVNHPGR